MRDHRVADIKDSVILNLVNTEQCLHCRVANKTVDHLATKCDRMLDYEYTRRHNEVLRFIHLMLCNKYRMKILRNRDQEIVANENIEMLLILEFKWILKYSKPNLTYFIR